MASPLREVLAGEKSARLGPLPKLQLPGADAYLSPFIEDVADAIATRQAAGEVAEPNLYRRDMLPVYPEPEKKRLKEMPPEYFVSWAERCVAPYKTQYDRNGDPFDVDRPMPKEIGKSCLLSYDFQKKLPPIHRTYPSPMPIIPEGGPMRLCLPGYERDTGTYTFPSEFQPNPDFIVADGMASSHGYYDDRMSLAEACRHLHGLCNLMPFSDWTDPFVPAEDHPFHHPDQPEMSFRLSRSLSVQMMFMLALFAGGVAPVEATRLAFAFNANLQRSAKTLLVKMGVIPVYGRFKGKSWPENPEEMSKILDTEVLAGSRIICFDNVRSLVASPALEGFISATDWTGRILGTNNSFDAENNAIIAVTGNNLSFGPDMQERSLISNLYVETADRQNRTDEIPRDRILDDFWLSRPANRHRILSSLWCIVRHWDAAGQPKSTGKLRRGFETWSEIFGGIVEFAGFGDPLERPTDLENCGDSETEDIRELVRIASEGVRGRQWTFQELVHSCWVNGLLAWCMHGKEEHDSDLNCVTLKLNDSANSKLGLLLKRNTSGERGIVHVFKSPDGRSERRIRFYCKGKGRARRYNFDEVNPR